VGDVNKNKVVRKIFFQIGILKSSSIHMFLEKANSIMIVKFQDRRPDNDLLHFKEFKGWKPVV